MTLTRRSTGLLTVLFIGLIALAADRTILRPQGGPSTASASGSANTGLLSSNVPVLDDEPPEPGVAERLDELWSGKEPAFEQMRNLFALPETWFEAPGAAGERLPDEVARFIRTHRLTAVVVNRGGSCALVDDRFLATGEILDGFTLVSVGDRSVLFEREGRQILLEMIGRE